MKDPNIVEVEFDVSTLKKISPEIKREIFMALQKDPISKVAVDFGFDKRHDTMIQARSAVYGIYKQLKNKPDMFGLSPMVVEATRQSVEHRKTGAEMITAQLDEGEKINFIKDELGGIRDKTAKIISMKLDRAMKFKREREKISLKELAGVLATVIDKSRLLGGQSTENVLHYAKVAKDISPDEALGIVLKAREALMEDNK